ncbi:MAG: hypothetical protein ACLUHA_02495 [Bacteroides stercoris]
MVKRISVKHIACLSRTSTSAWHTLPNVPTSSTRIFTREPALRRKRHELRPETGLAHAQSADRLAAAVIMFPGAACLYPATALPAALHAAPCLQDAIQAQQDCWSTVLRHKNRSRHEPWAHW